jgi:hypothetical protein
LRRPLAAAGEQRDRASVVGAGGERAADGELDPLEAKLRTSRSTSTIWLAASEAP